MVMGMPSGIMDLPTPRDISMVFVKQYYTLLNEAPDHVHRFYSQDSSFVHGGLERGKKSETKTAMGQKEINDRIQKLQFRDARTKIKQVDAHPTLAGGVVIQVSGQLSNNGAPMRPFMQTFVLAPQTTHNYYVYNDIFRYQDDLFSDDEDAGDGAAEADDEAEPESPPVPPPAAPAPAPVVAPAAAPAAAATAPPPAAEQPATAPAVAPAAPAPAPAPAAAAAPAGYGQPAHMNGHGAPAAAAAPAPAEPQPTPPASPPPAPAAETVEPETAPAPAPAAVSPQQPRQPSPQPPRQPSPQPVSNEPKTYANLFKASSGRPAAPRAAAPAPAAAKDQSPPSRPAAARPAAPAAAPAARPQSASAGRSEPSDSTAAAGGGGGGGDPAERRRFGSHPDNQQIFVGNLPQDTSNSELIEHFSPFGEVVDIKIHSSKPAAKGVQPRNYPNYGFIVFDSAAAVHRVLQDMPVKLCRQGGDEEHRLNIEKKQQQRPGEGRGRGDRPGEGRGRGFYGRGAPRGRAGYGRGGEPRGGGRGGYQSGPRR